MSVPSDSSTALPLHEKVYQNLSSALMQGEFHPGQKLTLRALADELGTSISPIREAISRLAVLINKQLLQYAQQGQTTHAMKHNHRFHFAVYRRAGSSVLLENIEQIWLRVGPSVNQLLAEEFARDKTSLTKGFGFHQKLIQALHARDAPGALGALPATSAYHPITCWTDCEGSRIHRPPLWEF